MTSSQTVDFKEIDVRTAINALYMIFCTALLPIVVIGIAFFYSGLTQRRSSLTMFAIPILLLPLIFIDWFIWGYSLSYSASANHFIGNLNFAVLRQLRNSITLVFTNTRGEILVLNHFLFNGFFKVICAALTMPGCIAERGRIIPMLVFLFFWSAMIYNPVTYWFWNSNGWLSIDLDNLPVLDFAGGNCIHIVGGFTCLAYSYILGPRNPKILYNYRNINTGHIIFGTFCILSGWVGFIAGCDFKFSSNSLYIMVNTLLAAFSGSIVWTSIDYFFSSIPLADTASITANPEQPAYPEPIIGGSSPESIELKRLHSPQSSHRIQPVISQTGILKSQRYHETKSNFVEKRKFSMISFSSGMITGLVVFTPGGGFVSSPSEFWKPIIFGVVGAIICNLSTRLKYFFGIDDALDIFAIHGVAGIVGSLLTGLFANTQYQSQGGWVKRHWIQFAYQLLGITVTSAYVFILTCVFLLIIDRIPGLHLRIDKNFNARQKQQKTTPELPIHELESQVSPHDVASNKDLFWEQVELQGTDTYEFNGEYMMDFIEFIKVIRPQDYEDNDQSFDNIDQPNYENLTGLGADYEMHPEGVHHLTKRE
ncbi:ammonium transporter [Spathaspora passalidarum NRRL Y-27907]|uniref:Ammonium transporter n=1 Tax=Spathaspora passalidarum (strain NRRL Y-27907 / 11-Y1) TaxID=619300 RepID=G3AG16_SPAPN|nr:ammonium transporter [Spathaspora passalidarum NRRL Y-27907]EGW35155.1 ammonium transporter [Spathaspora passalidarum NRRL Y-27907]